MGRCATIVEEIRFKIQDSFTECFVYVRAEGDCPHMVQGWHYKAFGKEIPVSAIMTPEHFDDHLLWPLNAPQAK